MPLTAEFDHGFAKGDPQNGLIAFNMTVMPWQVGDGLNANQSADWNLESATGGETMFADHLIGELRKKLKTIEEDRGFCRALLQASQAHGVGGARELPRQQPARSTRRRPVLNAQFARRKRSR